MNETKRIRKLFDDLYNGSPWIDVNLSAVLEKISAKQATRKISPNLNSIWEIVNHLVSWRLNVLQRVQGKEMKSPANNYFSPVNNSSEAAWTATLKELNNSQKQWIAFLQGFNKKEFDTIYPSNNMNYYEHIHGILQHDAYHMGQIVLLAKAQGKNN